jgi:hypothetical protein
MLNLVEAQHLHLSKRPLTSYDWMVLCALADNVNSPRHVETKGTDTLTSTSVP